MTTIQSAMPDSVCGFLPAIKATIEKYEPRLKSLRVRHVPARDNRMELRFEKFVDDDGRMKIRYASKGRSSSMQAR